MSDPRSSLALDDFLRDWAKENVRPLRYEPGVDPSDREYVIRQRAIRLTEAAQEKGLYSQLLAKVRGRKQQRPQADVLDYVERLFERAESDKLERDALSKGSQRTR